MNLFKLNTDDSTYETKKVTTISYVCRDSKGWIQYLMGNTTVICEAVQMTVQM